jgi:hypothetical protein
MKARWFIAGAVVNVVEKLGGVVSDLFAGGDVPIAVGNGEVGVTVLRA